MSKNYPFLRLKHLTRSFAFVLAMIFVMKGTTSRAAAPVFARHVIDTTVCSSVSSFSIDNLLHFTDADGTDNITVATGPFLVSGAGATGSVSATTTVPSGTGTLSPSGTTFGGYGAGAYGIRSFKIMIDDGTSTDTVRINVHLVHSMVPSITGTYSSVHVGEQISFTGTDFTSSFDAYGAYTTAWTLSPGSNATVNASGVVTGTFPGNETLSYTVSNGACADGVATTPITVLTNVAPTLGSISGVSSLIPGRPFVINGSNFNTTAGNYTVYFGAVKAGTVTATTSTLTVNVPNGATNAPIYVLDNNSRLSSFIMPSPKPVFDSTSFIKATYTNTYAPNVQYNIFNANTAGGGAYSVEYGDIDGDGKPDLVVVSTGLDSVLVYRNNSIYGRVNQLSYAAPKTFKTSAAPISCRLADMDGDGKLDIITAGAGAAQVSVLRNTSTSGSLSFATRFDLACAGILPDEIAIADFNRDGRPDIAAIMTGVRDTATVRGFTPNDDQKHGRLIMFKNNYNYAPTVDLGVTSFDTAVTVFMYDTFSAPISLAAGDMNADGAADIVVSDHHKRQLNLFRNISIPGGAILFSAPNMISTAAGNPTGTRAAHNSNVTPGNSTALPSPGDYNYAVRLTGYPEQVKIGDLDNDGKVDLVVAVTDSDLLTSNQYNKIVVFHNTSSSSNLTFDPQDTSLNTSATLGTGITPVALTLADINGDGKLDIINSNAASGSISIHKNAGGATTYSFGTPVVKGLGGAVGPVCPAVGDIDGNNIPDIAVVSRGTAPNSRLTILRLYPQPDTFAIVADSIMCNLSTQFVHTHHGTNDSTITFWRVTNHGHITLSGNADTSVTVNSATPGTDTVSYYIVQLADTNVISKAIRVTVAGTPPHSTITGANSLCAGTNDTLNLSGVAGGTWTSQFPAVATVSATGVVHGLSAGVDTIRYVLITGCGNDTAYFPIAVTGLSFAPPISGLTRVCTGASNTISLSVSPTAPAGNTYRWRSTNPAVSSIDAVTGIVTGNTPGQDTMFYVITNSCSSDSTFKLDTVSANPTNGSISGASPMCIGQTVTFTDVTSTGSTSTAWSSSSPVATVNAATGAVTAVSAGAATISFAINGCQTIYDTLHVDVQPAQTASPISGPHRICIGSPLSLTAAAPSTGSFAWHTTNPAIATVNGSGMVTGVTNGNVDIHYVITNACGSDSTSYTDTIGTNPVSGVITGSVGSNMCNGTAQTLTSSTSNIYYSTWTTSAPTVVSVAPSGSVTAVANALSAGVNTTITATLYGCSLTPLTNTFTINVQDPQVASPISGPHRICIGSPLSLTAAAPATGSFTWHTTNPAIATVTGSGMVTGVANGNVDIHYVVTNACGSDSTSYTDTIGTTPSAGSISGNTNMCNGTSQTLTDSRTGIYYTTWSSAAPAVVAISGTTATTAGVSAIATGANTTITATMYGCAQTPITDLFTINVNAAPSVGTITGPTRQCIGAGASVTLTHSGPISGIWTRFSAATTNLTGANPTTVNVVGLAAGVDTIYYTVSAAGCPDSVAKHIDTVQANVVVGPITGPAGAGFDTVCIGGTLVFNDTSTMGTWSSVNTSIATVLPATGPAIINGVAGGTTTISYTVNSGCGAPIASTRVITVRNAATAGFITGNTPLCTGVPFGFTTSGDANGTWFSTNTSVANVDPTGLVVGSLGTPAPGANPSAQATIKYAVANVCNTDTASYAINIRVTPNASAITTTGGGNPAGLDSLCITSTLQQTATPNVTSAPAAGLTIVWSFSNANATITGTGAVPTTITGAAAGLDTLTFRVSNSCGFDTARRVIKIKAPLPAGTIVAPSTVCYPSPDFQMYDTLANGDTTYNGTWSVLTGGTSIFTTPTGMATAFPDFTSTTIIFTVPSFCGSVQATKVITVVPGPAAGVTTGNPALCVGTTDTLSNTNFPFGDYWTTSDVTIATVDASGVVTGNAAGSVDIYYVDTSACGSDTASFTVNVGGLSPTGYIYGQDTSCIPGTAQLYDTVAAAAGGVWSIVSGSTVASINPATGLVTALGSGAAVIAYTTTNGCGPNDTTFTFRVFDAPHLVSPLTATTCDSVVFTYPAVPDSLGSTFAWTRDTITGLANIANAGVGSSTEYLDDTVNTIVTTSYVYTSTLHGCSANDTVKVSVTPTPHLISPLFDTVCSGAPFTYIDIESTTPANATWIRPVAVNISNPTNNGVHSINETLIYTGPATAGGTVLYNYTIGYPGCPTHVETVTVSVNPTPAVPLITTHSPSEVCSMTMDQNFGSATPPPAGVNYTWFATGAQVWATGSTRQYSLVNFTAPGSAVVYLLATIPGLNCPAKDSFPVNVTTAVSDKPEVIYFNGDFVCLSYDQDTYQWGYDNRSTLDSELFAGETNQNYREETPDFTGKYYFVITTHNGCMQKTYYNAPTGVTNVTGSMGVMKVFPNPADQFVNVEINNTPGGKYKVEVVNLLGQTLNAQDLVNNKTTIGVADLASGVYFINCYHDGVKFASAKFVKN
ncbi:T9SS type A sorting domain-containing protein [Flavipsychrobacter stenotrophus]|nr:T9SS type A sorting domain-containing protein [Flavipsychrobacter stenotrophus]